MRISKVPSITPSHLPTAQARHPSAASASEDQLIWQVLVPRLVHPVKLGIIEMMRWVGQPLSAADIQAIVAPSDWAPGSVRYHLEDLCRADVVEVIDSPDRNGHGPEAARYFFNTNAASSGAPERRQLAVEG